MNRNEHPSDPIDLESFDLGPAVEKARTATFAPNWKSVLAVDGFCGLLIVLAGVAALFWIRILGIVVICVGCFYVFLVVRRFLQWRWLRRQVGLG